MNILYFLIPSHTYLFEFYWKEDLSCLLHLFINLITYLYQYVSMNIYFILWVIFQCYHYLLYWKVVPALTTRSSFRLVIVFLPSLFSYTLGPEVSDYSYFPATVLESSISLRSSSSFYCRMVFINKGLGARCAHCYQDVMASRSCPQTKLGNRCLCTNTTWAQVCVHPTSIFLFLHQKPWVYTDASNSNLTPPGSF